MKSSSLESRIIEDYVDGPELIALIRRIGLEDSLERAINQIEASFTSNQPENLVSISGVILNNINSKLSSLQNNNEKEKLEFLLADIFEGYVKNMLGFEGGQDLINRIYNSLQNTCELSGYDASSFFSVFNIKKHLILIPHNHPKKSTLKYKWNGIIYELDGLIKAIVDKKWVHSVKELKALFKDDRVFGLIRCNIDKKDELLLLFQYLKEAKLITPQGNSGHFSPFVNCAVDNEGNFLFKKSINKRHEVLKRNKLRYSNLRAIVEKIVSQNASKSLGQLVDNGHCPPQINFKQL